MFKRVYSYCMSHTYNVTWILFLVSILWMIFRIISEAYNWNFEETMTDLQLPRYDLKGHPFRALNLWLYQGLSLKLLIYYFHFWRYQPKKKKRFCGYIGSTMLFVIKSIAVFLLMTVLIRARFLKSYANWCFIFRTTQSLYDRFIAAPRLYKIIRANG